MSAAQTAEFAPDRSGVRVVTAPPPPASSYSSARVAAAERQAVFASGWMVAGLVADVANPKTYLTTEIAGVPVVVTRDRAGVLHAMANVCQHRAMILKHGAGKAPNLTCPNHAWAYALDGQLTSAPRTAVEKDFTCADIRLPSYSVHEWGPLVLVNLDPRAPSPVPELERVDKTLGSANLDLATMRQTGSAIDWSIEANWKIVIENFLECYHCAWVHPDFSRVFDVSHEKYASVPHGTLLCSTSPVKESTDLQQQLLKTDGPMPDSHWYLLFPSLTVNIYPGQGAVELTWYWPSGPDTTDARTVVFVAQDATASYEKQVTALLTQVGSEDISICESMHAGMRSGVIERARVLPRNEALLTNFHALLRERLSYDEVDR